MILRSKAPMRLSFGGGGTDVSPYTEKYGGVALNITLTKYAWASLEFRKDSLIQIHSYDYSETIYASKYSDLVYDGKLDLCKAVIKKMYSESTGFNLYLRADAPPKSGLGGSGAMLVAIIELFNHLRKEKKMTPYEIAELAYELERKELAIPGGRQDQYASVFGGLNFIEFKGNDFVRVIPLKLKKDILLELQKNLVLVRIASRTDISEVFSEQTKNIESGKTIDNMNRTKAIAYEMKYALLREDLYAFGELLHTAWEEKKKFASNISNTKIDQIYTIARNHGALGGKITGAGGGGHMIFYCKPNLEDAVKQALIKESGEIIAFNFDFDGVQSWEAK